MIDPQILKDYIESSGVKYDKNSVSYIFTCPRCSKDKKLYIRKRDGRFICWVCKVTSNFYGKNPAYALAELLGLPFREVCAQLYGQASLDNSAEIFVHLDEDYSEEDFIDTPGLINLPVISWPHDYCDILDWRSEKGREYLQSRGISTELAAEYGLKYSPVHRRVGFPASFKGNLYGYQGRLVVDHVWYNESGERMEGLKILSSRSDKKISWRQHIVMFLDRVSGLEHAVIAEGPISALKAHLCGGNVATMGKAISWSQINLLLRLGVKKFYLALDPDAFEETSKLVRDFGSEVEVYEMEIPLNGNAKRDLGDCSLQEAHEIFKTAPRRNASNIFVFLNH